MGRDHLFNIGTIESMDGIASQAKFIALCVCLQKFDQRPVGYKTFQLCDDMTYLLMERMLHKTEYTLSYFIQTTNSKNKLFFSQIRRSTAG
jgi:hypothetical protein